MSFWIEHLACITRTPAGHKLIVRRGLSWPIVLHESPSLDALNRFKALIEQVIQELGASTELQPKLKGELKVSTFDARIDAVVCFFANKNRPLSIEMLERLKADLDLFTVDGTDHAMAKFHTISKIRNLLDTLISLQQKIQSWVNRNVHQVLASS